MPLDALNALSLTSPPESEWVSIRTMLMKVLGKFPEAKAAVVQGLMELRGMAVDGSLAWAT